MDDPDTRLAVYGTLGPGAPNHHVVADITGRWYRGTVRGVLRNDGWGSELGYPGIVLGADGPTVEVEVEVEVLESTELAHHWARLDEFEGPGYRRRETLVATSDGLLRASIYEVKPGLEAAGPGPEAADA